VFIFISVAFAGLAVVRYVGAQLVAWGRSDLRRTLAPVVATGPLAALSLSLFPAFPVTEMVRAEWGMRFSCLWPLPAIIEAERANGVQADPDDTGRRFLQDAVAEDFERWRPELVLVQETYQFEMLGELSKDARFRQIWQLYRRVGEVEYFQVFERIKDDQPQFDEARPVARRAPQGPAPLMRPRTPGTRQGHRKSFTSPVPARATNRK
jgi:hypothetical protein